MVKKYLIILFTVILLTGCGVKNKQYTIGEGTDRVTFTYPETEKFTIDKITTDDQTNYIISNTEYNIEANVYFVYSSSFTEELNSKVNEESFKKFEFNGYQAYGYQPTSYTYELNILLTEDNITKEYTKLYMYINNLERTNNTDLKAVVESKNIQDILSSISYK